MFGCSISNVGTMGGGSLIFGFLYLGFRVAVVGLIIYLLFKLFNGGNNNNCCHKCHKCNCNCCRK